MHETQREWRGHDVRCMSDHFEPEKALRPDSNVRTLASGCSYISLGTITSLGYQGKLATPGWCVILEVVAIFPGDQCVIYRDKCVIHNPLPSLRERCFCIMHMLRLHLNQSQSPYSKCKKVNILLQSSARCSLIYLQYKSKSETEVIQS